MPHDDKRWCYFSLLCFPSLSLEKRAFLHIILLVTISLVSVSVEESRKNCFLIVCLKKLFFEFIMLPSSSIVCNFFSPIHSKVDLVQGLGWAYNGRFRPKRYFWEKNRWLKDKNVSEVFNVRENETGTVFEAIFVDEEKKIEELEEWNEIWCFLRTKASNKTNSLRNFGRKRWNVWMYKRRSFKRKSLWCKS